MDFAEERVETTTSGAVGGKKMISQAWSRTNLKVIADLLSDFDDTSSDFDMWEQQVKFLKITA